MAFISQVVEAMALGAGEILEEVLGVVVDVVGVGRDVSFGFGGQGGHQLGEFLLAKLIDKLLQGASDETHHGTFVKSGIAEILRAVNLLGIEQTGDPLLAGESAQVGGRWFGRRDAVAVSGEAVADSAVFPLVKSHRLGRRVITDRLGFSPPSHPKSHCQHGRAAAGDRLLDFARFVPLATKPVGNQLHVPGSEPVFLRLHGELQIGRHAIVPLIVEPVVRGIGDDTDDPLRRSVACKIGRGPRRSFPVESVAPRAFSFDDQFPAFGNQILIGGVHGLLRG